MHDGMSTFYIVSTSDLIGQGSKTTKKLMFKVHFIRYFLRFYVIWDAIAQYACLLG